MPVDGRSTAVTIAVASFFCVSMLGWICGVEPHVCCKRALIGAVVIYAAAMLAVRAINAILLSAIIKNQIAKQEEQGNDASD